MTGESLLALEVTDSGEVRGMPKSGKLVIGSDAAADLTLDDPAVDPRHCVVARTKGGRWALRDLGSKAGTFVNDARVERKLLFSGDDLRVGQTHLRVVDLNEPPDERLAGFRIERPVGRGSMGEVYLAVQESLQRRVALKVLSGELADNRAFIRQFQEEARAAAALNHPNVVHVYDVGEDAGRHWLAMEFMDGGSLEDLLGRLGPRPWPEVVRILREAARGLVFAAERNIVHRDIKPANLMRDASGTIKIADLGLALSERSGPDERVYGTPQFVAPEQARGEAVDARADLYSLGATAHRLLSGRALFEGRNTLEVLRNKMNRAAPLIGEHVEDVPVELEDLIADLLERDPADRPPSAAAVLQRLDLLGPDSSTEPRRSRLVLVGSFAALGVIGAAAWFGWSRFAAPTPAADSPREAPLAGAADLPELPGLPDLTADAEQPAERSDDASLAALEAEAQRALDDLERRARSGTLDAAEWRNVADSFAGTDAARRALDIADDLEGSIAEQVVQTAALTEELDTLRRSLQAAGTTLAEQLTALRAVPPEDIPLAADRAEAWIADLGRQWVAEADDELTRRVADFESRQEGGLFDEAEVAVHEMLAMFRAEESFDPGPLSAEWTRFAQRETEIQERFAGLPAARAAWERARVLGDQEVAARELTGPDSIETDLRNLDLERAAERLRALSERLSAAPVTSVLQRWSADAEDARAALHLLAVTHRNGLWRRRALPDPRRGRAAEVLDVDDVSMTLEVEGRAERLPWATFARTETLHQLFNGRLERAYTQDERNGIAALMRIAATMELLEATRSALFGTRRSPGAALSGPDLGAAFDRLFEWSDAGPALEAARREARARDLLVRVSGELEREDWSSAAFLLERLLGEHADSWVVLLLSNGKRTEGPVITAAWDSDSESD